MLEARIEISDELAAKGFKRAMTPSAASQIAAYYGNKLAMVWVVVAIVDGIGGAGHLIFYHLLALTAVWVAASLMRYHEWSAEIGRMKGWSFHAKLDEGGVTTKHADPDEQRVSWSFYKNYVEYDAYLQIEDEDGNFSFIPKTPELFPLIEFTKRNISEKGRP
ncbi:MAG TPA: hypothetical protein VFZ49_08710 [Pyrinomonadaceae bacterium]